LPWIAGQKVPESPGLEVLVGASADAVAVHNDDRRLAERVVRDDRLAHPRVKTFKFRDDQIKTVRAAIDRAKKIAGTEDESVAPECICRDYAENQITVGTDWLVETVAARSVDADDWAKFRAAANTRITAIAAPQAG
jgi:hypothetical protein